jgi:peptidoglycan/xylan/chitin deacetylase (PgdA/CDA1 family)
MIAKSSSQFIPQFIHSCPRFIGQQNHHRWWSMSTNQQQQQQHNTNFYLTCIPNQHVYDYHAFSFGYLSPSSFNGMSQPTPQFYAALWLPETQTIRSRIS